MIWNDHFLFSWSMGDFHISSSPWGGPEDCSRGDLWWGEGAGMKMGSSELNGCNFKTEMFKIEYFLL